MLLSHVYTICTNSNGKPKFTEAEASRERLLGLKFGQVGNNVQCLKLGQVREQHTRLEIGASRGTMCKAWNWDKSGNNVQGLKLGQVGEQRARLEIGASWRTTCKTWNWGKPKNVQGTSSLSGASLVRGMWQSTVAWSLYLFRKQFLTLQQRINW